jgi:hypothetical protein
MTPFMEQEIYEAAQEYRNAPLTDQKLVLELFEKMVNKIWNAAIRDAINMGPTGLLSSLFRKSHKR